MPFWNCYRLKTNSGEEKKGLGSGDVDYSVVLAASSEKHRSLAVHAMLGYTFVGRGRDSLLRDILLLGLAADWQIGDGAHLVAEITASRHPDRRQSSDPVAAMVGAIYEASDRVDLDVAFGAGLNDSAPR